MGFTEYNAGHLTGQPTADDVRVRQPVPFASASPDAGRSGAPGVASSAVLADDEIAHFKERGFLVKRGLIEDAEAFAQAADHMWAHVPYNTFRRDDAETWLRPAHEKWRDEDVPRIGRLAHGNWKMRSRGADGIGTEPFLVRRIANHPNIRAVAARLLGGEIKPARRVRGIYAIFPKSPSASGKLGPHADYMAAQLSAMVLANNIEPRSGGFTLWPGSHLRLHPHWDTVHGSVMSAARGDGFREARDAVLRDITPVEFSGSAGDVVFWHPRMLHSAGVNYSADPGRKPIVRLVIPCDYERAGFTYFDDDEFGPGEQYQWWVDTRNFREDVPATADNIWHGWAI